MSRRRANISAALQAHRALLLEQGARRLYVCPLDSHSKELSSSPRASFSDCVAAAHAWLQAFREDDCYWFRVIERSEMGGMSVVVDWRDILVYADRLPIGAALRDAGCTFGEPARQRRAKPGASGASQVSGTFIAKNGAGEYCAREGVPCYG